jgi:predicted amidophosphoribosyltransferase
MNKISQTKEEIIDYLKKNPNSKVIDIIDHLYLSKQAIQKHLKELIELSLIYKIGNPPKVFYSVSNSQKKNEIELYDKEFESFSYIDSVGNQFKGISGFVNWCNERGFDLDDYKVKWKDVLTKYEKYKVNGLIDSTNKFKEVFGLECSINGAYFSEFSSREIFGKTSIYSKLLLSKQVQDKSVFKEIFSIIKPTVFNLIDRLKINYIIYVPPTVKRDIQLMSELEKYLKLQIPKITVLKVKKEVSVPQKTLSKPFERKQNAQETFVIPSNQYFKGNILIIDDFIGSGSSINYIGQKVKNYNKNINVKVFGYAIAGSANGIIDKSLKFEVINEV